MFKIVTVLGTRPEIIRLSRIIPKLDQMSHHVLIHTGQNFAPELTDNIFAELSLRLPDHHLGIREANAASQIGQIIARCDAIFEAERPDRLLILGDTNSSLVSIMAKRRGIQVFHMEAGNRCFDDRVPEEINRRVIDHSSDMLLPYTERSRQHLLAEGIATNRIFVTGNPILEVIEHHQPVIDRSAVLDILGVAPREFFLVTLHRAENVDVVPRLRTFVAAFARLARKSGMKVIVSTHPRTRARLQAAGIEGAGGVVFADPFGFGDFVRLERSARCVLTDSGTVQEECCIFGVPAVTLRDTTERPETIECGSNVLSGCDEERIVSLTETVAGQPTDWQPPPEYLVRNVSSTIGRVVCGYALSEPLAAGSVTIGERAGPA
jgi:UDP-N-acetylglucosamine 2-epimerase (non-hydrolysing)